MIYLVLYIIGFILAFIIRIIYKKEDAKYAYEEYEREVTNGMWLISSLFASLLSWIYIIFVLVQYFLIISF